MQRFSSSELWGRAKQGSPLIPLLDGIPSKISISTLNLLHKGAADELWKAKVFFPLLIIVENKNHSDLALNKKCLEFANWWIT